MSAIASKFAVLSLAEREGVLICKLPVPPGNLPPVEGMVEPLAEA